MASPTPNSTLCADLDDLETRIEDIEDFIIAAFGVVASFIIIFAEIWCSIQLVPPTVPFPLCWICSACLFLGALEKTMLSICIILSATTNTEAPKTKHNLGFYDNLETRINNVEDCAVALLCVVPVFVTTGFMIWYWIELIGFTLRTLLYWTCTLGGLYLLFVAFTKTMRFYRNFRGLGIGIGTGEVVGAAVLRLVLRSEDMFEPLVTVVLLFAELPISLLQC
jgi:hypothetical protein